MKRLTPVLVAGACVVAMAGALLIPPTAYSERGITGLFSLFSVVYVGVGAALSALRPANALGWLMLGMGAVSSVSGLLGAYAGYALLVRPDLPLGAPAAWVTTWSYWPLLSGVVLMVLVFPEGVVPEGIRGWAARTCVVATAVAMVAVALTPGPMDGFGSVHNPFALEEPATGLRLLTTLAAALVGGTFLVALASIFLRRRRAVGQERGQLSWLAYAMVLMVLAQALSVPFLGLDDSLVALIAIVVAITAFPAGVAVAILRYRLYDIDRIISRTLVYSALTATLVATYSGSVLLLGTVLDPLTGENSLAVAGSTLAVAALFRPVRARIQVVVDRRFHRSRYDATRTVEAFAGRLRQEVDLDAVSTDLRGVVRETVQPAHVSLWLRDTR
jgi:hypothetical protein